MAAPRKRKSPAKSPAKRANGELVPQPHGGALRRGSKPGTNAGGTGRPPSEFKERMRALASSEEVEAYLTRCLKGEEGPKPFLGALSYVTDHGYGKPGQSLDLTTKGEKLEIRVNLVPDASDNG